MGAESLRPSQYLMARGESWKDKRMDGFCPCPFFCRVSSEAEVMLQPSLGAVPDSM